MRTLYAPGKESGPRSLPWSSSIGGIGVCDLPFAAAEARVSHMCCQPFGVDSFAVLSCIRALAIRRLHCAKVGGHCSGIVCQYLLMSMMHVGCGL